MLVLVEFRDHIDAGLLDVSGDSAVRNEYAGVGIGSRGRVDTHCRWGQDQAKLGPACYYSVGCRLL